MSFASTTTLNGKTFGTRPQSATKRRDRSPKFSAMRENAVYAAVFTRVSGPWQLHSMARGTLIHWRARPARPVARMRIPPLIPPITIVSATFLARSRNTGRSPPHPSNHATRFPPRCVNFKQAVLQKSLSPVVTRAWADGLAGSSQQDTCPGARFSIARSSAAIRNIDLTEIGTGCC